MLMDFFRNRRNLYKASAILFFVVLSFTIYVTKQPNNSEIVLSSEESESEFVVESVSDDCVDDASAVIIDVDGEVKNPSVYELPAGSRVYEAIDAAGGLTESADTKNTNLAAFLTDGAKLYIPNKDEVGNAVSSGSANAQSSGKDLVNINTADSSRLQMLVGVGPATAQKIIEYREEYGFKKIEDLKKVSGIGDKTFEKLKNFIIVE